MPHQIERRRVGLNKMKLGAIYLSIREQRNLTQKEMGELMGVSKDTIYLWEKNRRNPGGVYLLRLFYLADDKDRQYLYDKLLKPWIEWHKIEVVE